MRENATRCDEARARSWRPDLFAERHEYVARLRHEGRLDDDDVTPGEQFRRLLEQQASQSCIVPGIGLPHQLEHLKKPLVVSLHATPERLIQVRQNRLLSMGAGPSSDRQR